MVTRIALISASVCAAAAGCGGSDTGGEETQVAAAFYPIAYAVERIDGDAEIFNVTPPGAEPHDVELSARDVERVREADFVFYLGKGFQPALEEAVDDAHGTAVDLLRGHAMIAGGEEGDEHAGEESERDPHVWLDPLRYAAMVERIGAELGRSERADEVAAELRDLDGEFRRGLADCGRREIVTSHAAFGYLARRYRLQQIPITGVSPEAEPTPGELEHVIEEVREHDATTIFFETLVSPRLAETVARETGARTAVLNPLEGLTEEELDQGEDYLSVMRENLSELRRALGCR